MLEICTCGHALSDHFGSDSAGGDDGCLHCDVVGCDCQDFEDADEEE